MRYTEKKKTLTGQTNHIIIPKIKRLSQEEEKELIVAAKIELKDGTSKNRGSATERLISNHIGFINLIVKRVKKRAKAYARVPYEDMFQMGIIGFITTIERFEFSYNVKLITYASYWITHAIERGVENEYFDIARIPCHIMERLRVAYSRRAHLERLGIDPNNAPIKALGNKTFAEIKTEALDGASKSELDTIADFIPTPQEDHIPPTEENAPVIKGMRVDIMRLVKKAKLNPNEEYILENRFWRERRLVDIGKDLGLSRERVRQIEEKALSKLRSAEAQK